MDTADRLTHCCCEWCTRTDEMPGCWKKGKRGCANWRPTLLREAEKRLRLAERLLREGQDNAALVHLNWAGSHLRSVTDGVEEGLDASQEG